MPDEMVDTALRLWGPRCVLGGVDLNDFNSTVAAIETWEGWLDAWWVLGERHVAWAEEAAEEGRPRTAGEAYARAAAAFHFGKFVWVLDGERNREATLRAVAASRAALRILDPGARRIEIALDDGYVAGNLRIPPSEHDGPLALVVLVPGLDSTKEEFHPWERVFLDRGLATFAIDGLGQGESGHSGLPLRYDYERAFTALLDAALNAAPGIDAGRIGAAGVSLGGRHVVRAAAFDDRVRALVSVSAPFHGLDLAAAHPHSRAAFTFYSSASSDAEAAGHASDLDLAQVASRVTQPALVITGKLDRIVPWEQTASLADGLPNARFVLYDEGNHGCTNLHYRMRPLIADWLKEHLETATRQQVGA